MTITYTYNKTTETYTIVFGDNTIVFNDKELAKDFVMNLLMITGKIGY